MKMSVLGAAALLSAAVSTAQAEVKSLTSNELTETYIQDSTIIVTPAKTEPVQPRRTITYTIDPSEPVRDPAEELAEVMQDHESRRTMLTEAEEEMRRQYLQTTLVNDQRQPVMVPEISNRELNLPNVPPIQLPPGPALTP